MESEPWRAKEDRKIQFYPTSSIDLERQRYLSYIQFITVSSVCRRDVITMAYKVFRDYNGTEVGVALSAVRMQGNDK